MRCRFAIRLLVVVTVCLVGVFLVTQSFGVNSVEARSSSVSNSTPAAVGETAAGRGLDWAVVALLLGGTTIFLLRPRSRAVVKPSSWHEA